MLEDIINSLVGMVALRVIVRYGYSEKLKEAAHDVFDQYTVWAIERSGEPLAWVSK